VPMSAKKIALRVLGCTKGARVPMSAKKDCTKGTRVHEGC
jgi:hypothetical protein